MGKALAKVHAIKVPGVVPYYGSRPPWIGEGRPMFITTAEGQYRARDGVTVTVPRGFVTDLASTPRWLWSLLPPHGGLALASLPHDWGYAQGGKHGLLPKPWWDALFRDLLAITPDVPRWKAAIAYLGVRYGGKGGWVNGWHPFTPGTVPDWKSLGEEAAHG